LAQEKQNTLEMKKLLTLIAVVVVSNLMSAQVLRRHTPTIAFGMQMAQPRGDFRLQYDGYPYGLSANLALPIHRSSLEVGGGFSWNSMGSKNEIVSVVVGQDAAGNNVYSRGTMRIRSNDYRYVGFFRLRPFTGFFQPYADVYAGVDQFQTATDIEIDNSGYSEATNQRIQQKDLALLAGYGLGLRLRLVRGLYVDARFENQVGTKAKYVNQNTLSIVGGNNLQFTTNETRTNKYVYQLGLAIQF
jgi:hypothetical protein